MLQAMGLLLVAGLTLATPSASATEDGQQPDLSLLRQFHSYAPARLSKVRKSGEEIAARSTLMRKARNAWRKGDYALARKLFMQAFKAGEITAGWYLGYLYRTGRGGKVDHARAFRYYQALARRYDADENNLRRLMMMVDALVRVADYYRTGIGRKREKRDLRRAFRLYSMAAAHNHAGALYGMALVTLASNGRLARKRWAIGWLKRAAMSGHAPAARQLAWLAARGLPGVLKPDPVAAQAWRIIAMRLRGPGIFRSANAGDGNDAAGTNLSNSQRLQALRLAEQFLAGLHRSRLRAVAVPSTPPTADVAPAAGNAVQTLEASVSRPAER